MFGAWGCLSESCLSLTKNQAVPGGQSKEALLQGRLVLRRTGIWTDRFPNILGNTLKGSNAAMMLEAPEVSMPADPLTDEPR